MSRKCFARVITRWNCQLRPGPVSVGTGHGMARRFVTTDRGRPCICCSLRWKSTTKAWICGAAIENGSPFFDRVEIWDRWVWRIWKKGENEEGQCPCPVAHGKVRHKAIDWLILRDGALPDAFFAVYHSTFSTSPPWSHSWSSRRCPHLNIFHVKNRRGKWVTGALHAFAMDLTPYCA